MTLHHLPQQRAGVGGPVRVGLIGAGKSGIGRLVPGPAGPLMMRQHAESEMKVSGRCYCGQISFAAEIEPDKVRVCHWHGLPNPIR
jgi:hypothetical protein